MNYLKIVKLKQKVKEGDFDEDPDINLTKVPDILCYCGTKHPVIIQHKHCHNCGANISFKMDNAVYEFKSKENIKLLDSFKKELVDSFTADENLVETVTERLLERGYSLEEIVSFFSMREELRG